MLQSINLIIKRNFYLTVNCDNNCHLTVLSVSILCHSVSKQGHFIDIDFYIALICHTRGFIHSGQNRLVKPGQTRADST